VTAPRIVSGAVIAAGEGSRLRDFAMGTPKPLVEVAGAPLIAHVLENFEAAGIASAAVIFNEVERDCEAFVRERYADLVRTILIRSTRSSLESFRAILEVAPPGRLLVSTVDAFCPRKDFVKFVRRSEALPANATVLAVTRYVHDEKPLWVNLARHGRISAIGGSRGDAVTAGIYVFPEKVRKLAIPGHLGRLREFLAWLASEDHPIEAVEIAKVVDVDRAEDVAAAEELAGLLPSPSGKGAGGEG
jgi:NDP-sugar pyrophosphorylase family protein